LRKLTVTKMLSNFRDRKIWEVRSKVEFLLNCLRNFVNESSSRFLLNISIRVTKNHLIIPTLLKELFDSFVIQKLAFYQSENLMRDSGDVSFKCSLITGLIMNIKMGFFCLKSHLKEELTLLVQTVRSYSGLTVLNPC